MQKSQTYSTKLHIATLYSASCRAVDVQHLNMHHTWCFTTEVNHCDLSRLVFHGRIWSAGLKVVVGGWDVTPQDLICTVPKRYQGYNERIF